MLQLVHPELSQGFAARHDSRVVHSDLLVGCGRVGVRQAEGLTSVLNGRVGSQKCGTHVHGRMLVLIWRTN